MSEIVPLVFLGVAGWLLTLAGLPMGERPYTDALSRDLVVRKDTDCSPMKGEMTNFQWKYWTLIGASCVSGISAIGWGTPFLSKRGALVFLALVLAAWAGSVRRIP